MSIRTLRERLLQSAGYEVGSLLVATPICAWLTGTSLAASTVLVIVLTVATMIWSPVYNTIYDRVEWRLLRRTASARPKGARLMHAIGLEASDMFVSVPILMVGGGLDLYQAVLADLALLLVYVAYTYVYHQLFDWWRPVTQSTASPTDGTKVAQLADAPPAKAFPSNAPPHGGTAPRRGGPLS